MFPLKMPCVCLSINFCLTKKAHTDSLCSSNLDKFASSKYETRMKCDFYDNIATSNPGKQTLAVLWVASTPLCIHHDTTETVYTRLLPAMTPKA